MTLRNPQGGADLDLGLSAKTINGQGTLEIFDNELLYGPDGLHATAAS